MQPSVKHTLFHNCQRPSQVLLVSLAKNMAMCRSVQEGPAYFSGVLTLARTEIST